MSIKCLSCGGETHIIRSLETSDLKKIRRRECKDPKCRHRHTTYEITEEDKDLFERAMKAIKTIDQTIAVFF